MRAFSIVLAVVSALWLTLPVFAQTTTTAAIWHDRGDTAALDLVRGSGGAANEPGVEFWFIKESAHGSSPKFEVEDEHGVTWKVKLGEEARSETAAARLMWAAGYLVDDAYYRPSIHVHGLTGLVRGREFVSDGDTVAGARLERDGMAEDTVTWSWYANPFVGTREFNGLRVMMALVNNWDLKEINNGGADAVGGGQYGVTDLGATFGRTGNNFTRSKGVPKDYAEARFIENVTRTHVDFRMRSRPFFLSIFNLRNYRSRTQMQSVGRDVPIADAQWIGARLGQLSAGQISDCFRSSGFSPADVEVYTTVVQQRIAALNALVTPTGDTTTASGHAPTSRVSDITRCVGSTCRQAPVRERTAGFPLGTRYVEAVAGGFEQGAGLGGGVRLTTATAWPAVQLRATVLTSVHFYRRVDLEALLPSIGSDRNHADLWFTYLKRDTDVHDIGTPAPVDLKTQFALTQHSYQASFSRDFADHLQGGIYAQRMQARASPASSSGTPIDEVFSGSAAETPSRWLPGLMADTRIVRYGAFVTYDTRDDGLGLTQGLNAYGRVASASSGGASGAVTSYGWFEGDIDLRAHVPLGGHKTSLLLRSRAQLKAPRGGRQIPFYDLSVLGGRGNGRGYHSYRYRGNNAVLFSTELQRTVRSLTDIRGVDVFTFVDTGQVWGDARVSIDQALGAASAVGHGPWHSGFGAGLQYRHSRHIAARLEFARGRDGTVTYVSMTRGF